jgi:hypothetical protein
MSIDDVRDRLGSWEQALDKIDGAVVDTDKLLARADTALEVAERGLEAGRRRLPQIAIGLAVVGVGVAVAVMVRKRRQAAAQWQVLEQPEDEPVGQSMRDVAEGRQDASDLADAADVIDGQQ